MVEPSLDKLTDQLLDDLNVQWTKETHEAVIRLYMQRAYQLGAEHDWWKQRERAENKEL